jgi:hypothetical protein
MARWSRNAIKLGKSACRWLIATLAQTSKKGTLGVVLQYPLNRWDALCRYRDDGRLEIDNLAAERSLRGPAGAKSSSSLTFPPPSGPWGALQALMDDDGQVTMGAVDAIPAAAIASMPQGMLAGLMRRNGESWNELLLRLNEAVMQSVVENRVISDLHV